MSGSRILYNTYTALKKKKVGIQEMLSGMLEKFIHLIHGPDSIAEGIFNDLLGKMNPPEDIYSVEPFLDKLICVVDLWDGYFTTDNPLTKAEWRIVFQYIQTSADWIDLERLNALMQIGVSEGFYT